MPSDDEAPSEMKIKPTVNIIGAGIAGLSLAQHLQRRNIPFHIYERAASIKGHNYGITLSTSAVESLQISELARTPSQNQFQQRLAVDTIIDNEGLQVSFLNRTYLNIQDSQLRKALINGVKDKISFSHQFASTAISKTGVHLKFEDGSTVKSAITIDTTGLRSQVFNALSKGAPIEPEVLSYPVYHGSRYILKQEEANRYTALFDSDDARVREWSLKNEHGSHTRLEFKRQYVGFADLPSPIQKQYKDQHNEEFVELRYTFSRPAKSNDPIFKPRREKDEAKEIPEAFYTELSSLLAAHKDQLPDALSKLLQDNDVKKDRILNWLLRVQALQHEQLLELARQGVLLIGDAAHGLPIVASEGASVAMADAEILAEWLARRVEQNEDNTDLTQFYDDVKIRSSWSLVEQRSRRRLELLHKQDKSPSSRI